MSTNNIYDYRWYTEGRYLAILQRTLGSVYDPYFRIEDLYVTPSEADSSAIYVRYTVTITTPTDEESDLGVTGELGKAIVYYVKARLAEENEDDKGALKNMNRFYYYISREMNNRRGTIRIVMPSGAGVVK